MNKIVSILVLAAAAAFSLHAQAASHTGAAPAMKASEPMKPASAAAMKDKAKKDKEMKKEGDKK